MAYFNEILRNINAKSGTLVYIKLFVFDFGTLIRGLNSQRIAAPKVFNWY